MKPIGEIVQVVPDKEAWELVAPMSVFDEMTEEEVLYWSTPFYDELQARKEAHMRQVEEERALK